MRIKVIKNIWCASNTCKATLTTDIYSILLEVSCTCETQICQIPILFTSEEEITYSQCLSPLEVKRFLREGYIKVIPG